MLQIVTSALTFTVFSGLHAQTQCLPCPPLFHGRTGWAVIFLQVLVTGIVTSHKLKIPSQVYIALSKGAILSMGANPGKDGGTQSDNILPLFFMEVEIYLYDV